MNQLPTEQVAPRLSGWRALVSVLTDPNESFRQLGTKPSVLPPYLIQTLVGVLLFVLLLTTQSGVIDQAVATAMATQPTVQPGMDEMFRIITIVTFAFTLILAPWFVGLCLSLVALFFGQFQGGGVSFSAYFGMIGYARMPLLLSTLLGWFYQVATGKALQLSAAALLPAGSSPYLAGLLGMINPFGIWYYALLAIGFGALFGRSGRKGLAFSVTLFIVATIFTISSAGLASSQGVPLQ